MSRASSKGCLSRAQDVLDSLHTELRKSDLPPLGPEFKGLAGTDLNDACVVHRLLAKYEVGELDKSDVRKVTSIHKMLAYDATGPERVPLLKDLPVSHRKPLLLARQWLHDTFRGCKPGRRVRFPSGESFTSVQGWTDIVAKLDTPAGWECSIDNVDAAARICYSNIQLKRVVKKRFYSGQGVYDANMALLTRDRWLGEARDKGVFIGYYVFKRMFLSCVSIVGSSRVTTVPKNLKEDRVITCEPFWNMVVQLSIAADIKGVLHRVHGISLETAQDLHRGLIAHERFATIDARRASDSNWWCWIQWLWPEHMVKQFAKARTGILEFEGEYYPCRMIAPMGCGFTFEIMTLTLLAVLRQFDKAARVFGDDMIIHANYAEDAIRCLNTMGWIINEDKTFISGNFRESCGGFYNLTTKEHIVCYDLRRPETVLDVFIAIQKLERIYLAAQVSSALREVVFNTLWELLNLVPRDALCAHHWTFLEGCVPTKVGAELIRRKSSQWTGMLMKWGLVGNGSPHLYTKYIIGVERRPLKASEQHLSVLASFYSMRNREVVMSRKKEKLTRQTMVDGAHVALTSVMWACVIDAKQAT